VFIYPKLNIVKFQDDDIVKFQSIPKLVMVDITHNHGLEILLKPMCNVEYLCS